MGRPKKFHRDGVLDRVIPVFWTNGFAGANLQQIEEAAGVNKSGIYSEFESKDALFVAALKRYLDTGPAKRILDREPLGWHNIEEFLRVAPQVSASFGGCFSVNSTRDVATLPSEAGRLIKNFNSERMKSIRRNVAAKIHEENVDSVSDLIWTFFSGMCINANLGIDPTAHQKRVESFMILLRGEPPQVNGKKELEKL